MSAPKPPASDVLTDSEDAFNQWMDEVDLDALVPVVQETPPLENAPGGWAPKPKPSSKPPS